MNKKQELIKAIEQKIENAQSNIFQWERNLERYKDYLKELTDQLFALKLEIKNKIK